MAIYQKEMKQSLKSLCIWTASIASMMLLCILLFPEMKSEMNSVSNIFANMGGFTAAFGMDKLSFGTIMGFYGIECGNIMGLGGGFFAALIGITALANEEKEHTAEFLLTHPVSRCLVITQKLLAVLTQIIILNLVTVTVSLISCAAIGENLEIKEFFLLHLSYLILQIEISCILFGISAFSRRGSYGLGLGLALAFYFLNLLCNMSEQMEFLRYITPYAYAEASNILSEAKLEPELILIGVILTLAGIAVSYFKYTKKDIAA